MSLEGEVFEIIRGTTHDGPGIRTTVFLKSCPLECLWCQNPEGISSKKDIWWERRTCIGCLSCLDVCTSHALSNNVGRIHRDPEACSLCGKCVDECPSNALSFTSRSWSLDELLHEVLKDREYYDSFDGGVTVSGGEPLTQFEFVTEFFRALQKEDVHTALDTCGLTSQEAFQSVLPYTNHVLFDLKVLDSELHTKLTLQPIHNILKNLMFVADYLRSHENYKTKKLWIRTPLIPGATASASNITAIATFLNEHFSDVVDRWELCAFNTVCKAKYEKMNIDWPYKDMPLMTEAQVTALKAAAYTGGIAPEVLVVSGLLAS